MSGHVAYTVEALAEPISSHPLNEVLLNGTVEIPVRPDRASTSVLSAKGRETRIHLLANKVNAMDAFDDSTNLHSQGAEPKISALLFSSGPRLSLFFGLWLICVGVSGESGRAIAKGEQSQVLAVHMDQVTKQLKSVVGIRDGHGVRRRLGK